MPNKPNVSSLEELTWDQIRNDIAKINPELAAAIDEVSPDDSFKLFKASYAFGEKILKKGAFYLPDKRGKLVSIHNHDQHIQDELSYNLWSNPVTLILKNSVELFLSLEDRIANFYGPFTAGQLFGAWRLICPTVSYQPVFLWDLTAGARSLFMLPKISDTLSHNRIKHRWQIKEDKPKTILQHWEIFREIANSKLISNPWTTELLFFGKKWFDYLDDKTWQPFHKYLLKRSILTANFWCSQLTWDFTISLIKKKKKLKPSAYIDEIVRHLFNIALGVSSGFSIAKDDIIGPIKLIQQTYVEDYGLKNYAPIIMRPEMFNMYEKSDPLYYSLQVPTSMVFSEKSSERSTVVSDLYEVQSLISKYVDEISKSKFNLEGTPFYDLTKKVKFDYFHNNIKGYGGLRENKYLLLEDKNFILNGYNNDEFPIASTFIRGCVRIALTD